MSETPRFEIPPQMRELAERNVEQARLAYGQFMDMAKQAQDIVSRSSGAVAETAREAQVRALRYAQNNLDASFDFAVELARARDLGEAMDIHGRHSERQMRTYAEQAGELGRLIAEAAQKMHPR